MSCRCTTLLPIGVLLPCRLLASMEELLVFVDLLQLGTNY